MLVATVMDGTSFLITGGLGIYCNHTFGFLYPYKTCFQSVGKYFSLIFLNHNYKTISFIHYYDLIILGILPKADSTVVFYTKINKEFKIATGTFWRAEACIILC